MSSDLLFRDYGSLSFIGFSYRHTSQVLLPGLYRLHSFKNSHSVFTPWFFISHLHFCDLMLSEPIGRIITANWRTGKWEGTRRGLKNSFPGYHTNFFWPRLRTESNIVFIPNNERVVLIQKYNQSLSTLNLATVEPPFFAGVYFSGSASLTDSTGSNVLGWRGFSTIIILFGNFSWIFKKIAKYTKNRTPRKKWVLQYKNNYSKS